MRKRILFLITFSFVVMGASNLYASGQEYDSKETRESLEKKHKDEHRNNYHVEATTYHSHGTVGKGRYTHQHMSHDLDVPILEPVDLAAKPTRNKDGVVVLHNKYCPVTGDRAKSEHTVRANGVICNVACKGSIESINNNPEKYQLDLNHFEIKESR